MATRYTDEFRRDAVRIAISSGLTLAPLTHALHVLPGNGTVDTQYR